MVFFVIDVIELRSRWFVGCKYFEKRINIVIFKDEGAFIL